MRNSMITKGQGFIKSPLFLSYFPLLIICLLSTQFQISCGKTSKNRTAQAASNSTVVGDETCSSSDPRCCNVTSGNIPEWCPFNTKLLLVQMIFRHGDRTPLFSHPTDPYRNASGIPMLRSKRKGLLTKRGKIQAYELGTYTASRYKDFLEGLWIPEDLLVQSSISERSIMTAQTSLAGMFIPYCTDGPQQPEGTELGCEKRWSREIKWQPIPVFPVPTELDNKLRLSLDRCPAFRAELDKVLGCAHMQAYIARHEEVFAHVQNHTGLDHVDIKNIGHVYDTLAIQSAYGFELPEWTKKVFPEPMKSIEEFGFQLLSGTRQMIRLNGGPLLRQVIQNMKQRVVELVVANCPKRKGKKPRSKRLYMFSGHDTTVSAFLSALGVFEIHQPPYAAAVFVELHQVVDDMDDEYEAEPKMRRRRKTGRGRSGGEMRDMIVKVFYRNSTRDTPREMIIPACGNPCHLDQLEVELRDLLVTDSEWHYECNRDPFWLLRPFSYLLSTLTHLVLKAWGSICSCTKLL